MPTPLSPLPDTAKKKARSLPSSGFWACWGDWLQLHRQLQCNSWGLEWAKCMMSEHQEGLRGCLLGKGSCTVDLELHGSTNTQMFLIVNTTCLCAQSCLTLSRSHRLTARLLCPWNSPGKNTRVGCHFLLLGIFQNQRSNPRLLPCRRILYHWEAQRATWRGNISIYC